MQNTEQNCNVKGINEPFETVGKLQYFGTTLTNRSYIHEDSKVKQCKYSPRTAREGPEALDGGMWSTPRSGRFTRGKEPIPIV
jgi:hypothetical protein